ncbi:MAG: hypothetical protein ACHQ52_07515, partial [Candidatus Eisenbacteria bacterium]
MPTTPSNATAHRAVYIIARARARARALLALAVTGVTLAWPAMVPAGPLPGTWVPNVAVGTADDSLSGSPLAATSDTVRAQIQAHEALTLTTAPDTLVTAGANVTFAHRITDTGNVSVDARLDLANFAGDGFDLASLALWRDVDDDGRVSPGDTPLVPGGTITLAVGESATLLVSASVPANAPGPSSAWLMLRASTPGGASALAIDTTLTLAATAPPAMAFYRDAGFGQIQRVTGTGAPLYLQADAPGCDTDPTRPDTVTITLVSQRTGDIERYRAVETGPSTGRFRVLPQIVTALSSPGSAVSGSGVLDESPDDQITATLAGCGAASTIALVWIDPAGTVFDAHDDRPVPGARVTLIDVTGAGNGGNPGGPASVTGPDGVTAFPSTVFTDASGRFQFPEVPASSYRLEIVPPATHRFPSAVTPAALPPGHQIDAAASYGGAFAVADPASPVRWDVPLDAVPGTSLFVEKTASVPDATWGDVVEYAVAVANRSDSTLAAVTVRDQLPRGFAYVAGSARRDTSALGDPAGGGGPELSFVLGTLAPDRQTTLRYRLRVGAGTPAGDAQNAAFAEDGNAVSNTARATVRVGGGAFATEGIVTGSVYLDRDGDGRRSRDERGVPGVRVALDDGTWVITDGDGRFSFYGLTPRTHALALDRTTLPAGATPVAVTHRERGTPGLRFVDLRNGELVRADFALHGDAAAESAAAARVTAFATRPAEDT